MVVGIYSLPDATSPKRRCSEGSASLLPCGRPLKRWKAENAEETEVILEATDVLESSSGVVLLEDNGGIWHVDGLLELLAGALCATFGADPLEITSTSDGTNTSSITKDIYMSSIYNDLLHQPHHLEGDALADQQQQQQLQLPPPLPAPRTAKLTERNLQAHTASTHPPNNTRQSRDDDEDCTSVASLSAWAIGTASPRRQVSDSGGLQLMSLGPGAASTFTFAPRLSGAPGGGGSGEPVDVPEPRWPRRRLPSAGRW
ncbi:hypothetical protein Vretifemale_6956 [Volvox reticuliferus]|uniref:Uncharacterized protein n=1 Tax=Volvox reticuliferus TaxID=1737510 RepID=A0A8J4FN21_9CHLO|nr:hypothetical protein Vretifemale_6956 [Volvox reticuliferus]